ncbi:MAG: patatin-like phospholipase family protein [Bacillota bacterium]
MKKWGLALGGGGILGLAHVGVIQVLEQLGLGPSVITGTSAGAIVAGLYAAGVDLSGLEDITTKALTQEEEPIDVPFLAASTGITAMGFSGLIGGNFIEKAIDKFTHGATLRDARIPVALMSVDIVTGGIVVFTNSPPWSRTMTQALGMAGRTYVTDAKLSEAIRASISVPGVFKPKQFRSWSLVDGGIRDMVPVYEARRMGAEEVVAVDLSLHVEKPQAASNAVSILSRSFALASRESTERNINEHASITLQPDVYESGLPTPTKCKGLIQAGRECAERHIPRIKAMLV